MGELGCGGVESCRVEDSRGLPDDHRCRWMAVCKHDINNAVERMDKYTSYGSCFFSHMVTVFKYESIYSAEQSFPPVRPR